MKNTVGQDEPRHAQTYFEAIARVLLHRGLEHRFDMIGRALLELLDSLSEEDNDLEITDTGLAVGRRCRERLTASMFCRIS